MRKAVPSTINHGALVFVCALLFLTSSWTGRSFSASAQTPARKLAPESSGAIKQLPASAKRYALVIGVDEYQDTQINRLVGASNDAKALADSLVQYAGFPAGQVTLLASDQPPERQPTKGRILRLLSNLRGVPKDGLLVVAFSGHGTQLNGRAYLLPTDAQLNGDLALLEETAINVDLIRNWIRETGVGQVVIILDACRNNPMAGRGDNNNAMTEAYSRGFNFDVRNKEVTAFATIYATAVGQVAFEYKEKKHGYFTWALVEGLKGAAANEKGEVTLASLKKYVEEEVPRRTLMDLGKEKRQRPFAVMEGYKPEELVLAWTTPKEIKTPAQNITVDEVARDYQFWLSIRESSDPELFTAYIDKFPKGDYVQIAKSKLADLRKKESPGNAAPGMTSTQGAGISNSGGEEAHWNLIVNSTDPQQFKTFVDLYPSGQYFARARKRLSELSEAAYWNSVKDTNDPEKLNVYLKTYPGGAFAEMAKGRLSRLGSSAKPGNRPLSPPSINVIAGVNPEPSPAPTADQLLQTGSALANEGKWREAEYAFRQAIRSDPGKALSHASLGVTLLNQNRLNEAEAAYRQAVKLEPGFARWYTLLAIVLGREERWPETEESLLEAVRLEPGNAQWHNNLGAVLEKRGKPSKAESEFREATKLEPQNAVYQENLKRVTSQLHAANPANNSTTASSRAGVRIGAAYDQNSNPQAALKKAFLLAETNQFDESIAEIRRSIKGANDQCPECYKYLGRVYMMMHKYKDASAAFRQALATNAADEPELYNMLGTALFQQGDKKLLDESTNAFKRALDLSAGSMAIAYYNLGYALLKLGRKEEGIAAFESYLKKRPDAKDGYKARAIMRDPSLINEQFATLFTFRSRAGEEISLDTLRGKIILLDFWAEWCAPCRDEMPRVRKIWEKFTGEDFVIIGVSLDVDVNKFETYLQKQGVRWPQYFDGLGWRNKLSRLYGVNSIPHTVLIDQHGVIRATGLRGDALSKKIEELIKRLHNS